MTWTVYVHRDPQGEPLYVGCTFNLRQRTNAHRGASHWFPQITSIDVDSVHDDQALALGREFRLIVELDPPFNLQHSPRARREADAWQDLAGDVGLYEAMRLTNGRRTAVEALALLATARLGAA
jgi:hypothetical protein